MEKMSKTQKELREEFSNDIQQIVQSIKPHGVEMHEEAYNKCIDSVLSVDETLKEREATHGKFTTQALLSQSMKRWARNGKNWGNLDADMQESIDMILHKIARILNGDQYHVDSWHDISGYATLVENRISGE